MTKNYSNTKQWIKLRREDSKTEKVLWNVDSERHIPSNSLCKKFLSCQKRLANSNKSANLSMKRYVHTFNIKHGYRYHNLRTSSEMSSSKLQNLCRKFLEFNITIKPPFTQLPTGSHLFKLKTLTMFTVWTILWFNP